MGFSSIIGDINKILGVTATAFNAVETQVGDGVATVPAIANVAIAFAKADPVTAPYVTLGLDITSEVESIVTALRSIKNKKTAASNTASAPASN